MTTTAKKLMERDQSQPHRQSSHMVTVALMLVVAVVSLLFAEQVATGWLPLGERTNISRRDFNPIEIVTMVGTGLWGLVALWGMVSLARQEIATSVRRYFHDENVGGTPVAVTLATILLLIIGVIGLAFAEQVLTGWLALGERADISRRDINLLEWVTIIISAVSGLAALRTTWGLMQRDRRAWAWAQWLLLISTLIGLAILLNGMFDIPSMVRSLGAVADNLPQTQELIAPGLVIFLSSLAVYRMLTAEVETTPVGALRNRLAQTPGAGAIIGFFAILIMFSLASDLFLEQRSVAGLLATNITRGIVAIGITFLMISGEFDLSVGSVFGAGALVFLVMMTEGLPLSVLLALPLIVGGATILVAGRGQRIAAKAGASITSGAARKSTIVTVGAVMLVAGIIIMVIGVIAPDSFLGQMVITSVIPAVITALIFCGILGYFNGIIRIKTGIPSFIVTLGTLLAYRAILLVAVADGRILRYADYQLPPPYVWFNRYLLAGLALIGAVVIGFIGFSLVRSAWRSLQARREKPKEGDSSDFRELLLVASFVQVILTAAATIGAVVLLALSAYDQLGLSASLLEVSFFDMLNGRFEFVERDVNLRAGVMWWLILVLIFQFVLMQTRYGNWVFAVGGNPGAARAQGINVNRVKVTNFIICSMLAGLAGIITVARLSNVDPLMGDGLELEVIAASVIGGALLDGGYGSIVGSLLGVMIFGMLQTGLVLVGVDARSFSGVIGVIIILAVIVNTAVGKVRK